MKNLSRYFTTQAEAIAYIRGENATTYQHKALPIFGVIGANKAGRITYALWLGEAIVPFAWYTAANRESAAQSLAYYWQKAEQVCARRAQAKAEKAAQRSALKASDHWTVGDVISNSWGYDQTNVDFYQVTGVDAKSIRIRPIAQKRKDTGFMSGICQPDRFNFTGEEMRKPLSPEGRLSFRHGAGSKWDGKPENYSYYA